MRQRSCCAPSAALSTQGALCSVCRDESVLGLAGESTAALQWRVDVLAVVVDGAKERANLLSDVGWCGGMAVSGRQSAVVKWCYGAAAYNVARNMILSAKKTVSSGWTENCGASLSLFRVTVFFLACSLLHSSIFLTFSSLLPFHGSCTSGLYM